MTLDHMITEYVERFDENFPVMLFMGISEEDLIQVIQKSLDDGKTYELHDYDGSIVY